MSREWFDNITLGYRIAIAIAATVIVLGLLWLT